MYIKQLPKVEKKKINLKAFEALAKKVKSYFEEEQEYLEEKASKNENTRTPRFFISY